MQLGVPGEADFVIDHSNDWQNEGGDVIDAERVENAEDDFELSGADALVAVGEVAQRLWQASRFHCGADEDPVGLREPSGGDVHHFRDRHTVSN